jgi:Fibronectin type III domain.
MESKRTKKCKNWRSSKTSTKLKWEKPKNSKILGYKIYWRETTSPYWENSRFVGNINQFTLKGIVIDNYLFGVSSVGNNNQESVIVFPSEVFN